MQRAMRGGIRDVDARAQHGRRAPARGERGAVRRAVDSSRHPADHRDPRTREGARDLESGSLAIARCATRPDDCDARLAQARERADREQNGRRIGKLGEARGVFVVAASNELRARASRSFERIRGPLACGVAVDGSRSGIPRLQRRAECCNQIVESNRADSREERKRQRGVPRALARGERRWPPAPAPPFGARAACSRRRRVIRRAPCDRPR
jgi:hypothetical protein